MSTKPTVTPSAAKTLPVLHQEWEHCTRCELGQRRENMGSSFVFGEGVAGGIMFIGEGPGKNEAQEGRPFIGKSGQLLRKMLEKLAIEDVYITNAVCCRSFKYATDSEGKQTMVTRRGVAAPVEVDCEPAVPYLEACWPRLVEEIYLVDPILIVTLGRTAAETVLQRSVKIVAETNVLGPPSTKGPGTILRLPGAGYAPILTAHGVWRRKVKGQYLMPTEQSHVEYPVLPLLHPAYVLRSGTDRSLGGPPDKFRQGLNYVRQYYNAYVRAVYGEILPDTSISIDDMHTDMDNDE